MNERLKQEIKNRFKKIDELRFEINELAKPYLPDLPMFMKISDFWDCKESPFGLCAYYLFKAPGVNACVWCGEPEERK